MERIRNFFRKPKNVYFSIIFMLTLVVGLMTVSFSYYVDDSTNNTTLVSLAKVNNVIQSDALKDNKLELIPGQEATFTLYVMSNNEFDSAYKLFYKCKNTLVSVTTTSAVRSSIEPYAAHAYNIIVKNNATTIQEIEFGITNGYPNKDLIMPEDAYEIK